MLGVIKAFIPAEAFVLQIGKNVLRRAVNNGISPVYNHIGNGEAEVGFAQPRAAHKQNAGGMRNEALRISAAGFKNFLRLFARRNAVFHSCGGIILNVEIIKGAIIYRRKAAQIITLYFFKKLAVAIAHSVVHKAGIVARGAGVFD